MRGEVQSAERVEAQAPARTRLREGPDGKRRLGAFRDLHRHRRVGEGDLKDQEDIDRLGRKRLDGSFGRGGIEEKRPCAHEGVARTVEGLEGPGGVLFREGNVEGRPRERKNADAGHGQNPL